MGRKPKIEYAGAIYHDKIAYARNAQKFNFSFREIGGHIKLTDVAVFKLINKQA